MELPSSGKSLCGSVRSRPDLRDAQRCPRGIHPGVGAGVDRRASRRQGQHRVRSSRPPCKAHGCGEHVALRCPGKTGQTDITYAELARRTNTFANALRSLGYRAGSARFSLCWAVPALYVAILGTLKAGRCLRAGCSVRSGRSQSNNGWSSAVCRDGDVGGFVSQEGRAGPRRDAHFAAHPLGRRAR